MSEGNEGFPLPFQWDDGEHFAPVVFTKEEDLKTITDILLFENINQQSRLQEKDNNTSTKTKKSQQKLLHLPSGPIKNGEVVIDAGCGNGRVPLFIAATLLSETKNDRKNIKILGVDIEEELVEKANKEAKSLGFSPEQVHFVAGDLRKSVDLLTSCHFIYCYLLPGEMLTELMNAVTKEWRNHQNENTNNDNDDNKDSTSKSSSSTRVVATRVIISNTWEISCLEDFFVGRVGEMWVYDRNAANI